MKRNKKNNSIKCNKMSVHLGKEGTVLSGDIVGIFDLEQSSTGEATKEALKRLEKEYKTTHLLYDLPKSFILLEGGGREEVYILSNSVETELKRLT